MKILSIIGARPQYVKASVVCKALETNGFKQVLLNTGQHYDPILARVFIEELGIGEPAYNLNIGSGTQGYQTAQGLRGIEEVLIHESPDRILVYGDTNATLAGALAAAKLNIPVDHVEAGLRSFNRSMPEEINRIVADLLSTKRFCPTTLSVSNLEKEGMKDNNYQVGDVMVDTLNTFLPVAEKRSPIMKTFGLDPKTYVLMTIHRPSNADDPLVLRPLLETVNTGSLPVVFPAHPRVRMTLDQLDLTPFNNIRFYDPVGYLDMLLLESNARCILTDSGGVQKEAYLQRVPCLTYRTETEWQETVEDGWNILVHDQRDEIPGLMENFPQPKHWKTHYGSGDAAQKIAEQMTNV